MHGHLYSTYIELQGTEDQGTRQIVNCYLRKLLLSSKGKKQSQVNRTFWVSGKAIERNKETPGGDVHIDFVIPTPPPQGRWSISCTHLSVKW